MVSESVTDGVMSACAEFTQNAWKKDLCINCQRPRGEHAKSQENESNSALNKPNDLGTDSPKPAKRNSLLTKSWTAVTADVKNEENEDDQWNAMCLPDPDQPDKRLDVADSNISKPLNDHDNKFYSEHSYEDIDGEDLKQGQSSHKVSSKGQSSKVENKRTVTVIPVGSDKLNTKSDGAPKAPPKPIPNPEERLSTLINDGNRFPPERDSRSRSRSSSRDKSPASGPKPKLLEKPVITDKAKPIEPYKGHRHSEGDISKPGSGSLSPRSRKKLKKGQRSISFKDTEVTVIGEDGGLDNLYSDHEEDFRGDDEDNKEILKFTEDEKEWALQALKNTIWNSEHINAESDKSGKKNIHSKEYEDIKMESLWKPDRFANVRDCDPLPESATQNFGTFPLRTKSEKTAMDNMFSGNRLSTLSESLENMLDENTEDKYEAVLKFLGADKIDFSGSPKHKNLAKGDLNASDCSDPSYDDPWEGKFGFENESEMNLLDEIKGEIDLDSSSAGFALVDLLNDVLAKYSTGTPSETDSVKNLDSLDEDRKQEKGERSDKKDGKEKSAELEAKMVTLAQSLRKQRAKGRAPRPPSCPPEPPPEVTNSPQKQLELRAAQSKEPTFKMVPIGKPIGGNPPSQTAPTPSNVKAETAGNTSTSSSNSSENMESYKIKNEKDKQPKKSGGGMGGFFSRIFRRGRDSDTDLTVSSETLVSNSSDGHSDTDSLSEKGGNFERQGSGRGSSKGDKLGKGEKRTSKSSPQMKLKVLPTRPISPKPPEKPPHVDSFKKETEKDSKPSQNASPKGESKTKDNVKTEKSDVNTSQKNNTSKPDLPVSKLSPSKSKEKELATSPKTKEAPPLPLHPPREGIEPGLGPPKPRARGNSDGGVPRSRPRARGDTLDGKLRDTPNVPPPKPPVAVKPRPPAAQTKSLDITDNVNKPVPVQPKERLASTSSLDETAKQAEESNKKPDPRVLRKRAKSPKRFAAPVAPTRTSMPNILSDSNASLTSNTSESSIQSVPDNKPEQPKGLAFAKELEQKLHKEQGSATLEGRKLSAPPPLPTTAPKIDTSEKSKSLPTDSRKAGTKDKDIPKPLVKDTERSRSNSKDDLKTSPPANDDKAKLNNAEIENQAHVQEPLVPPAEMPVHTEKIELPKAAGHSRKSFLGKLNRKNKPPAPPSVKRTKSITESHVLADHHLKKIDLKDISGPVLITEMSSSKVVNRRNTISLGDDNSFLSGGSTSSGSTSGEKSDISPRGSVENLYEFIKSEAPTPPVSDKKNLYDPVVENNVVGLRPPSMTGSEGYLEPIKSNSAGGDPMFSSMAESTISMGSMTTSMVAMGNNMADLSKSAESFQATDINQHGLEDLDISPERRELLASQPIYEEITNGYGKLGTSQHADDEDDDEHFENIEEDFYGVHDPPQTNEQNVILASNLRNKESFSSDSEMSSANNSLSRPRPFPRKRPRHVGSGFEQYVAMNRPSVAVFLNEEQLREMLSKLTAMNLNTLRDIYTQHEKCFTKESLQLGSVGPLKWQDFDIYGKPLHTSEKCVVYNAKMRTTMSPCQVMLLHSRPEITAANHPSLLKPTCIFTDSVPFTYLTDAFIKTSQILETTVNQANANMAKCFIVVGLFDITESLSSHMNALETVCENQRDFLRKVLFFVLQLLSAISHCLEQGHPLSEADFHDLYLISNPYCLGETVSFLPQVRAPEDQRIDRVCLFLEKFLLDMCAKCEANAVLDDSAFFIYSGVQRVIELVESGVAECLPIVRSYTEFLLWGPGEGDSEFQDDRQSNLEPKLSMWLEKERALLIHDFAGRIQHGARCNIKDFYKMKFLLKASSASLAECIRCHTASSS